MDFIVLCILLVSAILGARKGLVRTLISFGQWFLCILLGLCFCKPAYQLLADRTGLDEALTQTITGHLETTVEESAPYQAIPDLFRDWVDEALDLLTSGAAAVLCEILLYILSFLLLVLLGKLILFAILHHFVRRYRPGVLSFLDRVLGFVFGTVRGFLLVLLFFAVLVPVLGLVFPSLAEPLTTAMQHTYLADLLYQDNVLLVLLRDLFS